MCFYTLEVLARCLIVGMLHPDASVRISVTQAQEHPWLARGSLCEEQQDVDVETVLSQKMKELAYEHEPKCLLLELQQQQLKAEYQGALGGVSECAAWGSPYVGNDHGVHEEHFDDTEL